MALTNPHDPKFVDAVWKVLCALNYAEAKHPTWPALLERRILIISEEMGEAQKSACDLAFAQDENEPEPVIQALKTEVEAELAQTAAMCIRYLMGD